MKLINARMLAPRKNLARSIIMAKIQCDCQYWPCKLPDGSLDIVLTGHHEECPDRILTRLNGALELIKELLEEGNITARSKAKYIVEYLSRNSEPSPQNKPQKEAPSKPRRITLEQAKSLYIAVTDPPYEYNDAEWKEIHNEMEAIIVASGPKIAAKVIEWWEVWDKKNTTVKFAKRIRALAAEQGIGDR